MRRRFYSLVVILLFLVFPTAAVGQGDTVDGEQLLQQQQGELDFSQVLSFIEQLDHELGEYLPDLNLQGLLAKAKEGEIGSIFHDLGNGLLKYLFHELLANSALLGQIIILGVVAAVLQNLQSAFEGKMVGKLAYSLVYLVLLVLALNSFRLAADTATQAIESMAEFIQAVLPLISTMMVATGGFTTAALLHPFVFAAAGILSSLFKSVVFPLIFFSIVLDLVGLIFKEFQVSKLSGLFKQIGTVLMGLSMMVFIFILGLQGVAGAVSDGVAMRTAKFATGAFIPVVGKSLADALEVVVGTSLLLKNAIGIVGVVVLLIIAIFPAVKILVLVLLYNISAALIQPFGEENLSHALGKMSGSLALIFGSVAGSGLMFFMALSILVWMGNLGVMLR